MKKTLVLFVCCISLFTQISAQNSKQTPIEVTGNPLGLLFIPDAFFMPISVEAIVNDHWGVGVETLSAVVEGNFGFALYGSARHFFNPKRGGDRFYLGSYAGGVGSTDVTGLGLGFMIGQKWVSAQNVVFDISIGLGRDFTDNIGLLPYGKLHVGYRFNSKNKGE